MKKNITTITSIIMLMFVISSCSEKNDLNAKKEKLSELKAEISKLEEEIAKLDTTKKDESLQVLTEVVTPRIFKTYIEVQGRVDAEESVSLSSQMPGLVTRINVKVGQKVSKGQVLAETDASAIYQQMSALQTNLDLAKVMFQKQENLWKQKVGTEMQYLQAKTNKENLERNLSALNEQVRMSKIISPINGTVDAVNIKIAQQIAPGMPAINVVNFNNLKIKADVAESYSSRVKAGNEVLIVFPDTKDSIKGKINYSSRAIDLLSRTFGVEVLLDGKKQYQPNMVAKLKINDYQSATPQIVVPVKFVQKGAKESYVLVAKNGVAVKKIVTIGKEYDGMAQIISGLDSGEMMITKGYDQVIDGDKIQVKK